MQSVDMNGTAWLQIDGLWSKLPFVAVVHGNRVDWGAKMVGIQIASAKSFFSMLNETRNFSLIEPLFTGQLQGRADFSYSTIDFPESGISRGASHSRCNLCRAPLFQIYTKLSVNFSLIFR